MVNHLKWNNSFNSGCYRWKIQFYGYSSLRNMLRMESRNHSKQFIIYAANGNVGWYSFVPNITALYNIYYNMVSWFHFVKKCSIRSPKCSTQPKPRFQQSETTFKRSYLTQWMIACWTIVAATILMSVCQTHVVRVSPQSSVQVFNNSKRIIIYDW